MVDDDSLKRNESEFQADFIKYLNEYKTSEDWSLIEHWRDRIANIDLSHVKAKVVYSVPGAHRGHIGHVISCTIFIDIHTSLNVWFGFVKAHG